MDDLQSSNYADGLTTLSHLHRSESTSVNTTRHFFLQYLSKNWLRIILAHVHFYHVFYKYLTELKVGMYVYYLVLQSTPTSPPKRLIITCVRT